MKVWNFQFGVGCRFLQASTLTLVYGYMDLLATGGKISTCLCSGMLLCLRLVLVLDAAATLGLSFMSNKGNNIIGTEVHHVILCNY